MQRSRCALAANAALREAEFGNTVAAQQAIAAALALAPGRDVKVLTALAWAHAADNARAKAAAEQLEGDYAQDTMVKFYWLPTIYAAIANNSGHAEESISLLEGARPYELGLPPQLQVGTLYPFSCADRRTWWPTMAAPQPENFRRSLITLD